MAKDADAWQGAAVALVAPHLLPPEVKAFSQLHRLSRCLSSVHVSVYPFQLAPQPKIGQKYSILA